MPCESQDRSSGVTRLGHPRNSDLRNGDDVECAMTCACWVVWRLRETEAGDGAILDA